MNSVVETIRGSHVESVPRTTNEMLYLIRKLRWVGYEEEAKEVEAELIAHRNLRSTDFRRDPHNVD
jgi:hypothetical protein